MNSLRRVSKNRAFLGQVKRSFSTQGGSGSGNASGGKGPLVVLTSLGFLGVVYMTQSSKPNTSAKIGYVAPPERKIVTDGADYRSSAGVNR